MAQMETIKGNKTTITKTTAPAENRTRGPTMATLDFTTKPLALLENECCHQIYEYIFVGVVRTQYYFIILVTSPFSRVSYHIIILIIILDDEAEKSLQTKKTNKARMLNHIITTFSFACVSHSILLLIYCH